MRSGLPKRIYKDPYGSEEVECLVEDYEELNGVRSKAWVQVRLMDLDLAYASLPPAEKEAVLLVGFMGLSVRTAGDLVGIDHPSVMWYRYQRGLDYLSRYMNGVK